MLRRSRPEGSHKPPGRRHERAAVGGDHGALLDAAAGSRFYLHYQPLVSVGGGEIVGVEALLRWDAPTGRVPAAEFVPVLEAADLIATVDDWVLSHAARQGAAWDRLGHRLLMSVNVSAARLQAGYAAALLDTLVREGFPPERLCLDLTHTASLADHSVAGAELRQLKRTGVRLFLDDFGTSAGSVADMKRFDVDAVKIDRSFVAGLGHNGDDEAIVAALIDLAHALRLRTIAEGVENEVQLATLRALGCDLAQGFYLSEPSDPREIVSALGRPMATLVTSAR